MLAPAPTAELLKLEQQFMHVLDGWEEDSSSPAAISALQYALGAVRDAMHRQSQAAPQCEVQTDGLPPDWKQDQAETSRLRPKAAAQASSEPIAFINRRLEDLAEANALYGKDQRLGAPDKIARNEREISWLKDLRSMIALGAAQTGQRLTPAEQAYWYKEIHGEDMPESFASGYAQALPSVNETETVLDAINDYSPRARQTVDLILYKFDVRLRTASSVPSAQENTP